MDNANTCKKCYGDMSIDCYRCNSVDGSYEACMTESCADQVAEIAAVGRIEDAKKAACDENSGPAAVRGEWWS